jgi:hypothetical protein
MTAAKASLQGIHDGVRVDTAASVVALAITYGVIRWDRHQEKYVVPGQGAPQ